jgi:membrane peptidoglycan carboxypeptidase
MVATEDATFFTNPGFSPTAIIRSLVQDLRHGNVVMGGSTITQQLVKNVYLTPEITFQRKVKEAILAAEITRRYSKSEILEIYLNEVYFGNQAYGIGAAVETYFDKPVSELTLPEAALLVGFLQAPAYYDPYTNPDAAIARRNVVLGLMRERGYIDADQYAAASAEPLNVVPFRIVMEAPHMVAYVREQLEAEYGPEVLYRGGLRVYTTLDLAMQQQAEQIVAAQVAQLADLDAHNGALVALDPANGDILALVGSADFYDDTIDGQVNVAGARASPAPPSSPSPTWRPWSAAGRPRHGHGLEQDFPDGPIHPTIHEL